MRETTKGELRCGNWGIKRYEKGLVEKKKVVRTEEWQPDCQPLDGGASHLGG